MASGDWESARQKLEEALEKSPRDALLWSDASAIYLQSATNEAEPFHLVLALEAANKALILSGRSPEPYFNRALVLERLGLVAAARKEWANYLRFEKDDEWAKEAQQRLSHLDISSADQLWADLKKEIMIAALRDDNNLTRYIAKRLPFRSRRFGEEELLARWANLDSESDRFLKMARNIGLALLENGRDRMLLDATVVVADSIAGNDANRLKELAAGHKTYFNGIQTYERGEFQKSRKLFAVSSRKLLRAGSPLGYWAVFYRASCAYQFHDYDAALRSIAYILAWTNPDAYPNLTGKCLWLRGLILLVQSRYGLAHQSYDRALPLFEQTGESDLIAGIRYLKFEYFYATGAFSQSWIELIQALRLLNRVSDPNVRQLIFQGAAFSSMDFGHARASLEFLTEAVNEAIRTGRPVNIVEALRWRAEAYMHLGNIKAAQTDLSQAYRYATAIHSEQVRQGINGNLLLVRGKILRKVSAKNAVQHLNGAIRIFKGTDYYAQLVEAYVEKSLALESFSPASAETALLDGIEELERQRALVGSLQQTSFWDSAQSLFDEMILHQVEKRRRPDLAYNFLERARGVGG